jgi:hypothetical protein
MLRRALLWILLVGVVLSFDLAAQKPANKTATPSPATQQPVPQKPMSTCPDTTYQKACDSYAELVKAGDESVRTHATSGGLAYVCFRQGEDQFFIIELRGPSNWSKNYVDANGKVVPADDAESEEVLGLARGFVNGIRDNSMMPISLFRGRWSFPFDPSFSAQKLNNTDNATPGFFADANKTSGLLADSQQVEAFIRYPNRLDKKMDYRLVIQRSTGRFSESFTEEGKQIPFSENQGRCMRLP